MIEFTLSRVVLCVCGAVLLASALGALSLAEEGRDADLSDDLAGSIAATLDRFNSSKADSLWLDGNTLLPTKETMVHVHDHVVTVVYNGKKSLAYTDYSGDFDLQWGSGIVLTKSGIEAEDGHDNTRIR